MRNTGAARRIKPWLFGTACVAAATWSNLANSQGYSQPTQPSPRPAAPAGGPGAPAPNILSRPFAIVPSAGLQEFFTDNVDLSEQPRESDFITRFTLGATAQIDRGRLTGHFNGEGFYDLYARHPSFSGWSVNTDAQATYAIVRDRLTIEAAGSIVDEDASLFNGSAIDRSGTPGRTRIAVYYIGPKFTTDIRDFAKLTVAGRVGQVNYAAADNSEELVPLPSNDTFLQGLFRLDTGERVRPYQLLTTSVIEKDNRDYSSANLVQSVYYRVRPGIRVIGRAGYERVRQQSVADINSPVLSVGLEFRPNEESRISIEGGERYNRGAWAARANVRLAPRFTLYARHSEVLAPDQIHLANDFDEFIAQSEDLPVPTIVRPSFQFGQNIYNQTSYNKLSQANLNYDGAANYISFSILYSDRLFLDTDTKDRSLSASISATRHIRPDLDLTVGGSYTKTYESPVYGASHSYGADATLLYRVNTTVDVQAGYSYRNGAETFVGGDQFRENVAFVAIQKQF